MDDATLRGDCIRCIGLCCVALAFDRGALFAFDKPAGTACCKLGTDNLCGIHASLAAEGFAGCAAHDFLGTGQLVIEMFEGRSWREGGAMVRATATALGLLRDTQAARMVLDRLPPTAERQALLAELDPTAVGPTPGCWRLMPVPIGSGLVGSSEARAATTGTLARSGRK